MTMPCSEIFQDTCIAVHVQVDNQKQNWDVGTCRWHPVSAQLFAPVTSVTILAVMFVAELVSLPQVLLPQ